MSEKQSVPTLGFTTADRQTGTFIKMQKFLEERLAQLRRMNDAQQAEEKTALLRGRISEIKRLMDLCEGRQTLAE
jgi:hypothetical protein